MQWPEYRDRILASLNYEDYFMRVLPGGTLEGDEYTVACPFSELHEGGTDEHPSFSVNVEKGVYYCYTCHSKGNIHTFLTQKGGLSAEEAWYMLGDTCGLERPEDTKPHDEIDPSIAVAWHNDLMEAGGSTLAYLTEERGIAKEVIEENQIGFDGERYTIPIYDELYVLRNIRRYKRNPADGEPKMLPYIDESGNRYGRVRLYGVEHLRDEVEEVFFCEGEWDRLRLESAGAVAITSTGGAYTWDKSWLTYLRRAKRIYAVCDNDEAGRQANDDLVEHIGAAAKVYVVSWPEDFPKKGDVSDWLNAGYSVDDLRDLCVDPDFKEIPASEQIVDEPAEGDTLDLTLAEAVEAAYTGKRMDISVMLSGKASDVAIIPTKVVCQCWATNETKSCAGCALHETDAQIIFDSSTNTPIALAEVTDEAQKGAIKSAMRIPKTCNKFTMEFKDRSNLEEVRMVPIADDQFSFSKDTEHVVRTGYFMGNGLRTNKRYTMSGYMHNNPKNQRATFIFDEATPEQDPIEEFKLTDDVKESLRTVAAQNGVEEKFNEIHADLEYNVTRIWSRRDVAMAIDLIYHTPMHFDFQGEFVKRGWGELCIIGDSGQAKSTIVERIMAHYNLGEFISGESAKRTGLTYSLQQAAGRWYLIWGALPLNDGGLVAIDEFSGLSEDDIAQLSDIRSSGVCRVRTVINDETSARTRAIYIANPRSGRSLKSESYGVKAILSLFGKAEDVRRLDLAIGVTSGEVDAATINSDYTTKDFVEHTYTSKVCHDVVMWAWSRTPEQIDISSEATHLILSEAVRLAGKYSAAIPLAEPADMRLKLARLSIAAAARVGSTDDSFENIYVKPEHVAFVVSFLERVYDSPALAYDEMSKREFVQEDTSADRIATLRRAFRRLPLTDHNEAVSGILRSGWFKSQALSVQTNTPYQDVNELLHFLVSNSLAADMGSYGYKLTATGTTFFKELEKHPYKDTSSDDPFDEEDEL